QERPPAINVHLRPRCDGAGVCAGVSLRHCVAGQKSYTFRRAAMRKETPSQTVGPFYSIGLTRRPMNVMATESTQGQRICIEGQVLDGDGQPVPDAMVEIWQANAYG